MIHPKSWKLWMIAMAMAGMGASTAGIHVARAHRQANPPLSFEAQRPGNGEVFNVTLSFTNDPVPDGKASADVILFTKLDKVVPDKVVK